MNWIKIIKHVEWASGSWHSSHIGAGLTQEYKDKCKKLLPKLHEHVKNKYIHTNPSMKSCYDERDNLATR